jgi:hypothetical protein
VKVRCWVTGVILALPLGAWAQVPIGSEFIVNAYTPGLQERPRIAVHSNGDFLVVWHNFKGHDGDGWGAFGRRLAANGTPMTADFVVSTVTIGNQTRASVAMAADGSSTVTWDGDTDGDSFGVFGRRFSPTGTALGPQFQINTYTSGFQAYIHAAHDVHGNVMFLWTNFKDFFGSDIVARRFDSTGNPITGEFIVKAGASADVRVAALADGGFVMCWDYLGDGSDKGVFCRRYDNVATPLTPEFQVNAYTTGRQTFIDVAANGRGEFAITWESYVEPGGHQSGIFARWFDRSGRPYGDDQHVNTYTTGAQRFPSISSSAAGDFVITWKGPDDGSFDAIWARRFDARGRPRSPEFRVNSFTIGSQTFPSTSSDANGKFVVAWQTGDLSGAGIAAQRFGVLTPTGLGVDVLPSPGDGNGVLEPCETVSVMPSWRNATEAAVAIGGAAQNFSGPPGATYAITDPSAQYGTVGNGAVTSCATNADCYAVSVSCAASRPAPHWDALFAEGLTPVGLHQEKTWSVHIGESYADVPRSSAFYPFIETILHRGVATGCASAQYCPAAAVTREQVAVFALAGKEQGGYTPPPCSGATFNDVPVTNGFCAWIEELARRGAVGGCGGGNYCPTSPVTREQMAVFVLRTQDPMLDPPACTNPMFNDVPASSPFCRWIEELARRGIVAGCGGGSYCPTSPVTREQMAVFIARTFGLRLYGP